MATTVARLEAVLSAKTADFERGMDRAETRLHKVGKVATTAGLAIAGGLAVGLTKSVHAAIGAEASQARLDQAFKKAHLSASAYEGRIKTLEAASRKLGFTEEDVHVALGSLVVATGSVTKATREVGIAQDLARFKGTDLATATKALTMANAGSLRALKQLGIEVPKVTTAQDAAKAAYKDHTTAAYADALAQAKVADKAATVANVMDTVTAKVGGQAEAYSKTAAGSMEQFKAQLNFLEISMGKALLPILTQVATALASTAAYFSKNHAQAKALTIALGVLATALLAVKIQQLALNLAILANPYILATAAIIGMSAALFTLWNRSREARTIIEIVAGVITMGLAPAIIESVRHFHDITGAISRLVGWLKEAVGYVKSLVSWLGKIPSIHIGLPHIGNPFGDGSGPGSGSTTFSGRAAAEGKAFNVGRQLWDEISMGEQAGLHVTSGYRPGAVTKHGTPSDHGHNPSRAVDMAGSASGMASLFMALVGRREVRQAFYDPLGSIFNGVRSSYREGGHTEHIHVAEYDKGGVLKPGVTLAVNNTGKDEHVVAPWQARYLNFMERAWQFARPFFPNALGGMPPVKFTSGADSLFVGTDFTPNNRNQIPPPGSRQVYWPKWLPLVGAAAGSGAQDAARQTLIHEWAHEFQDIKATRGIRLGEGGATAFAHLIAPRIYKAMGVDYHDPGAGPVYGPFMRWVLKNKGLNWITKGQFGIFDKGGWLQPGLTLAMNNTGRPERVGGNGGDVVFNFPNYVGSKQELMGLLRDAAAQFQNRNGRPAFGG